MTSDKRRTRPDGIGWNTPTGARGLDLRGRPGNPRLQWLHDHRRAEAVEAIDRLAARALRVLRKAEAEGRPVTGMPGHLSKLTRQEQREVGELMERINRILLDLRS